MRRYDRTVPELALTQKDMPMEPSYYGPGYGHPTEGARRALALMSRTEGISLDLTYTGKTLSGLLHQVRSAGEKGRASSGTPSILWIYPPWRIA